MAASATRKWENVVASIEAWAQATLGGTYTLVFPEQSFRPEPPATAEWIEIDVVPLPAQWCRSLGANAGRWIGKAGLTLRCVAKTTAGENPRRASRIAADVRSHLTPGGTIAFGDYAADPVTPPTLGVLQIPDEFTLAATIDGARGSNTAVLAGQLTFDQEE